MWRTLLRPRFLALGLVAVAVAAVFVTLGLWQMSVAQNQGAAEQAAEQAARPEVALTQVLAPLQRFPAAEVGRQVVVQGSYRQAEQVLVPNRRLEGETGYWVLTPLVVQDPDAGESLLPVLRGFVTDPEQADRPPSTPVTVRGGLAPGEGPAELVEGAADLPADQLASVDLSVLANRWDGTLYPGFVFAGAEDPVLTAPAVRPVPTPVFGSDGVDWRNLGYALQWWVFAGFGLFLFLRMVRDEHHRTRAPAEPARPHTLAV